MTLPPFSVIATFVIRELGNHLWQSTLFAGVAALLALTLRKYQARTRHWLWLAASVKFLIHFSLLIAVGSHLMRPNPPTESQTSVYVAVDEMSQPFTMLNTPTTSLPAQPTANLFPTVPISDVLAVVWLCGFFVVIAYRCLQWRAVAKAIRNAAPLKKGREIDALRRIERMAGIPSPIRVVSLSDSIEPGVFGILHPVLLWPQGISIHLDDAQLEAVIAHEVCHVRRRDSLTSTIHMLVEALFWFYPLVWWMEKLLLKERERACDEAVLRLCNQPKAYAESILKICEFCVESPVAYLAGVTGAGLKKRIMQIMTEREARRLSMSRILLLRAAAGLALTVPLMLGVVRAATSQTDSAAAAFRNLRFEVVSIRQNKSGGRIPLGDLGKATPDGYEMRNMYMILPILTAYGLPPFSNIYLGSDPHGWERIVITSTRKSIQPIFRIGRIRPNSLQCSARCYGTCWQIALN